jgi:hypothetical protein
MRCISGRLKAAPTGLLIAIVTLVASSAAAQTITLDDERAARAGVRVGYGGKGVDWDLAIDSPRFANLIRFRADVGHGSWAGINSAGGEPDVTRVAGAALLVIRPPDDPRPVILSYVGIGIAAYVPHRAGMPTQKGKRIILGMEASVNRWDFGPEIEIDLASPISGPFDHLNPAIRMGLAFRRRF